MPDVTIQEMDISFYWSSNYDPVTDVAGTGTYLLESGQIGSMVQMIDGSIWFDHDNDGWFDVGRRIGEDGSVEEYTGRWRKIGGSDEDMDTIDSALPFTGDDAGVPNAFETPATGPTDWFFDV